MSMLHYQKLAVTLTLFFIVFFKLFYVSGFDLWPKLSHNVTTLDNDDIDISMSHVLLFPKIYNLSVCHTIKANRQKSIPCYPTTYIFTKKCYQTLTISFLRTFFVIFIQQTAEMVEKWSRSITPYNFTL
jgi:hypothetical protein